jgi:hypothetical protein
MVKARSSPTALLALLIIHAATACSDGTPMTDEWDGEVRDSVGITIVDNFGTPLWAAGEEWSLSQVLKVGSIGDDPDYAFGAVTGVALLSDGRIVVADGIARHLKFFQADGSYERTVGRAGSGPEEFGAVSALLVLAGDTLVVADRANQRVSRIDPQGKWLGGRRVPRDEGFPSDWDIGPSGMLASFLELPYQLVGDQPLPTPVVRLDSTFSVADTLLWLPPRGFYSSSASGQEFRYHPGEPDFCLRSSGGLVSGHSDRYELLLHNDDGVLQRIVRLSRPKVPFTDQDQSVVLDQVAEVLTERGRAPERIAQRQSGTRFETVYPAFGAIHCGPSGSVWLQRLRPWSSLAEDELSRMGIAGTPPPAPEFDVFDANGRFMGIVHVPSRFQLHDFRGTVAYGVWLDELDVPYVVGLRIDGVRRTSQDR